MFGLVVSKFFSQMRHRTVNGSTGCFGVQAMQNAISYRLFLERGAGENGAVKHRSHELALGDFTCVRAG